MWDGLNFSGELHRFMAVQLDFQIQHSWEVNDRRNTRHFDRFFQSPITTTPPFGIKSGWSGLSNHHGGRHSECPNGDFPSHQLGTMKGITEAVT